MILSDGITLGCSQPWLVGVLGGPVVPAHQPRQIIDGNQTQRPTVSTSWNRGFAVRPQSKRATGVLCVESCIANNQRIIRRNLNKCFYQSNWIWCIHDFNHQLRIFKLKTFCFLKILLVIKYRQMYTALPVPSEKSTSHMCPITKLLLFKCHATFILPKWLRGNSELFSHIPLNVTFLSLRKI